MADAGTVTLTELTAARSVKKITFAWTSSAAGAADKQTVGTFDGEVIEVVQIPNSGGTQPSLNYGCTLLDDDGVDVLNGLGTNISNAVDTIKVQADKLGVVSRSHLYLHITAAGNAKGGSTVVYVR